MGWRWIPEAAVFAMHDEQLAARCDRVLRLVAGRLDLAR